MYPRGGTGLFDFSGSNAERRHLLFRIAIENRSDLSEQGEIRRSVSVTVLSACALMALVPWKLFDLVSVGRTLALIVLMASALKGGMLTGAAAGSVLGITTDLASGSSCFYAMSFALSGLLGGVFSRHSRLVFTLSFVLASALAATCAWSGEDMKSLAKDTLREAEKPYGSGDDMTVVTVRVEERV